MFFKNVKMHSKNTFLIVLKNILIRYVFNKIKHIVLIKIKRKVKF